MTTRLTVLEQGDTGPRVRKYLTALGLRLRLKAREAGP